ncbi:MAG: ATP-binding protein [Bacteroidales bacterium]|nr:ATP-binding protein [Bacteroidales bacterium]
MVMYTDLDKNKYDDVIVFTSEFHNISYADEVIEKITQSVTIKPDIFGNILLSLSEAINNAIVHGNQFDSTKSVSVYYKLSNNCLEIAVKDEGEGFDYKLVEDPTELSNVEKLSGRGVFIILNLADIVEFSYDNGQVVKMVFNL